MLYIKVFFNINVLYIYSDLCFIYTICVSPPIKQTWSQYIYIYNIQPQSTVHNVNCNSINFSRIKRYVSSKQNIPKRTSSAEALEQLFCLLCTLMCTNNLVRFTYIHQSHCATTLISFDLIYI